MTGGPRAGLADDSTQIRVLELRDLTDRMSQLRCAAKQYEPSNLPARISALVSAGSLGSYRLVASLPNPYGVGGQPREAGHDPHGIDPTTLCDVIAHRMEKGGTGPIGPQGFTDLSGDGWGGGWTSLPRDLCWPLAPCTGNSETVACFQIAWVLSKTRESDRHRNRGESSDPSKRL